MKFFVYMKLFIIKDTNASIWILPITLYIILQRLYF